MATATKILVWLALSVAISQTSATALPNAVGYEIEATLDTATNTIRGIETVTLTNHTGQTLQALYFHVVPNAFTRGADTAYQRDLARFKNAGIDSVYAHPDDDATLRVERVSADGVSLTFDIEDTLMRVDLDQPLETEQTLVLTLTFFNDLIEASHNAQPALAFAVRSGVRNGTYTVAKWYPQLVVYDEQGWHLDRYRFLGEFYGDFADYELRLTVPQALAVGASGSLVGEVAHADGTKTLTFAASRVRDVAWVAGERYQVSELTWNGKRVRALWLDQPRLGQLALDSFGFYSETFGPYAYDTFTVAQVEVGGGMEYPGIVMIEQGSVLEVSHEVAHQWWYAGVGNNEFEEGWLDEAPTTFSSELYRIQARGESDQVRSMLRFYEPGTPVLTRGIDYPSLEAFGIATYTKGSGIFWMLYELLGADVFLDAMRAYYAGFKYQNATTQDLIDTFEVVSGQDLGWFFEQWLRTIKGLDVAVENVDSRVDNGGRFVTTFTVSHRGQARMPVRVRLRVGTETLDVMWDGRGQRTQISLTSDVPVGRIELDPQRRLLEPFALRRDNVWVF